ncbi:MAG: PhzF family phenazine biosynthesis protein [Chloroflexota bacterium]
MVSSSFVLCDVFADRPFTGNPLAVFLDGDPVSNDAMDHLAQEFGWSEITFVSRHPHHDRLHVRIWTPRGELPFAGHPTIGTAVVLASRRLIDPGWAALDVGSATIAVEVTAVDEQGGTATMVQGAPHFGETFLDRERVAASLSLAEADLERDLPAQMVSTGSAHFLVPVRSLDALQRARPVPDLFPGILAHLGARWAYVFSIESPQTTAVARTRLLNVGMEDAATGSAAGPLGAYLVHYGLHRPGTMDLEQGIEMGRPSRITVDVRRQGGEFGPVRVSGRTVIWASGVVQVGNPSSRTLEV